MTDGGVVERTKLTVTQAQDQRLTEPLSVTFEREHREIDQALLAAADRVVDGHNLIDALHTLRRHIYAEEELMFPALREAGMVGPVLVMLREHAEMWPLLDTLDELIAAEGADERLRDAATRLLGMLQRHNPKEEAIVYPQVDAVIDPEPASLLRQLLVGGGMPEGWRCQHLR